MAIIITPQAEIDAYFQSKDLGQSSLKHFLKGFYTFKNSLDGNQKLMHYEEKEHLIIGSAVDCILTGETGEFEKQYYVSTLTNKPSDVEMSMIKFVFDTLITHRIEGFDNSEVILDLKDYPEVLKESIVHHAWYKGDPGEKRIIGLMERGDDYFQDLKRSFGKQVISYQENYIIHSIVKSLRTDKRTRRYFNREAQSEFVNIDFYYQLPIYFEYQDVECKALLDLVVVLRDPEGNVLEIHPYDLKTMSGYVYNFLHSLKRRRYDIQAAWYTNALSIHFEVDSKKIKPFTFIVESTTNIGNPLVFECCQSLLEIGRKGRDEIKLINTDFFSKEERDIIVKPKIKGMDDLLEEYKYFISVQGQAPKEIMESEKVLKINWEKIVEWN